MGEGADLPSTGWRVRRLEWVSGRRIEGWKDGVVGRWLSLIGIWVWTELLECQAMQLGWVLQSEVAVVRDADGWWLRAQVGDGQLEAVEVDEGQGPSDAGSDGKMRRWQGDLPSGGARRLVMGGGCLGAWRWLMGLWLLLDGVGRDGRGVAGWNGSSAVELGEDDDGAPYWCSVLRRGTVNGEPADVDFVF
ncbi:hypothetical protein ACLOJK_041864 [Asimina triloba]